MDVAALQGLTILPVYTLRFELASARKHEFWRWYKFTNHARSFMCNITCVGSVKDNRREI